MKSSPKLTREAFLECNWKYEPEQNPVSYVELNSSLKKLQKKNQILNSKNNMKFLNC